MAVRASRRLPHGLCGPLGTLACAGGVGDLRGSLAERRPGDMVETFTILTVEANETVRPVHGRMPAIVAPEGFGLWLAGEAMPLGSASKELLTGFPVSSRVNSPSHDDPECIQPLEEPPRFDWRR